LAYQMRITMEQLRRLECVYAQQIVNKVGILLKKLAILRLETSLFMQKYLSNKVTTGFYGEMCGIPKISPSSNYRFFFLRQTLGK